MSPFSVITAAIEKGVEPFVPPYSEDPEPPFLEEWLEASAGIQAVGHAALSMLSSSLQLFLKEWVGRLEKDHGMEFNVDFRKKGWFNGYLKIFEEIELPLNECPANLEVIEQVALVRNRVQHPEEITNLDIRYSDSDLKKYPRPFFAEVREIAEVGSEEAESLSWWLRPTVDSSRENVFEAVDQVESLCNWLEAENWSARNA